MEEKIIKKIQSLSNSKLYEYYNSAELILLYKIKKYLDDIYFSSSNTDSVLDDEKYDILKEILIKRDLNYKDSIGCEIKNKENKINLPIWMGSMNKIKPENENKLINWLKKNKSEKYILEEKIDGVSCLLKINKNGKIKIFTRGNGKIGSDITYFLKYFDSIPKNIKNDILIRGELVIYNEIFVKKFSKDYANARNFVSGRINGKQARKGIEDIVFIAYEIISENKIQIKPSKQLQYLQSLNFLTVNRNLVDKISMDFLSEILTKYKEKSKYSIDGIIIQSDNEYKRNIKDNPKYAFAFKMLFKKNIVKTEIEKVFWNISKWGKLKPQIKIKEIILDGNEVNFVTGHNAKYICENKLGKGSIVHVTRSGDVIPFIVKIEKCSTNKPDMPNIPYKWNDSKVDIISLKYYDKMINIKLCVSFFKQLNIKHLGKESIVKIINVIKDENIDINNPENYLIILVKIISADKNTLLKVQGFKELSVNRIQNNIKKGLENITLSLLLGASGVFGCGMAEKKIEILLQYFPDIFKEYKKLDENQLVSKIISIPGFSEKTSKNITKNIEKAEKFIEMMKPYITLKVKNNLIENSKLKNLKVVFSGFRDNKIKEKIIINGGKVMSDVSKNTSFLLVSDTYNNDSSKYKKAKKLNVNIINITEFIDKYI